ncbi:unnamed protein product [Rotaria magnacalcarata]|uniref:Uncharacterized protein n=2 Tax=Rotaria magnacalcarata TaxID=392030 RepID=A0A816AJ66_9BILA|nr:unnamed protein product [Rotaria magnacalcarata]CAF2069817.1 unnamed protein product [Rotaria magnacalcarata]CAF2099426.1 unnamed protein product [Rotaria magnacalcarata]CAF3882636.1 unnamed protein product [Rotaria magnacalcarata]CAF3976155.1 unnamed protein product [Rotaria magnacalcarata]
MTSAFPNRMSPIKDQGNSTNSRCIQVDTNQRSHLHTKRAVTLDQESHNDKLRVVVLGSTKVGKTCLCQQFLQEKFLIDHKETVDELYSVELSLVDRQIILEILDTAGIDEFPVMRRIAIAHGDAFLILYAVNDAHSFRMAQKLHQLILEVKSDSTRTIPIILVANKSDLNIEQREVNQEYAKTIVHDQLKTTLLETTCHNRESVLNAFRVLLQSANLSLAHSPDIIRRSSDSSLLANRGHRTTNKRQSCAQQ